MTRNQGKLIDSVSSRLHSVAIPAMQQDSDALRRITVIVPPPLAALGVTQAWLYRPGAGAPEVYWPEHGAALPDERQEGISEVVGRDGARLIVELSRGCSADDRDRLSDIADELARRWFEHDSDVPFATYMPAGVIEPDENDALLRVARALGRSDTLDELLRMITEEAARATGAPLAGMFLYDDSGTSSEIAYFHGPCRVNDADGGSLDTHPLDIIAMRERRPIAFYNVDDYVAPLVAGGWVSAGLVVPLLVDERVRGMLYLSHIDSGESFSPDEVGVVADIAALGTAGLERVRNVRRAERQAEQIRILNAAARAATGTFDLSEMFATVVNSARQLIQFDFAAVVRILPDGRLTGYSDTDGLASVYEVADQTVGPWLREITGPEVVRPAETENVVLRQMLETAGVQTVLVAPLQVDGETIGGLTLLRRIEREFSQAEWELAGQLADLIAVCLRNAYVMADAREAREAAEHQARQVSAIQRVAERLAAQGEQTTTLDILAEELQRLLPSYFSTLWELAGDRSTLSVSRAWGCFDQPYKRVTVPADAGIVGAVVSSGQALLLDDARTDPRSMYAHGADSYLAPFLQHGESMICVPLIANGETVGALQSGRVGVGMFSDEDLQVLVNFATHAAVAIYNARLAHENRQLYLATIQALAGISTTVEPARDFLAAMEGRSVRQDIVLAARSALEAALAGRSDRQAGEQPAAVRIMQRVAEQIDALTDFDRLLQDLTQIVRSELGVRGCLIQVVASRTGAQTAPAMASTDLRRTERGQLTSIAASVIAEDNAVTPTAMTRGVRCCGYPIRHGQTLIGGLALSLDAAGTTDTELAVQVAAFSDYLGAVLEIARQHADARYLAQTDAMTGVANYRGMSDWLEHALLDAAEAGEELALIMFDIDALKSINDTLGHLAGDDLLRRMARTLTQGVRASDFVARYGGDEFVVALPRTNLEEAHRSAQRLLRSLNDAAAAQLAATGQRQIASYGVAGCPDDGTSVSALFAMADERMYGMKRAHGVLRAAAGSGS